MTWASRATIPPPHNVKHFAASELLEQMNDRVWVAKVMNAINQHWQKGNAAKKQGLVGVWLAIKPQWP